MQLSYPLGIGFSAFREKKPDNLRRCYEVLISVKINGYLDFSGFHLGVEKATSVK